MVGSAPRKVSQTAPLMKVSGLFRDRADGLTFTFITLMKNVFQVVTSD